MLEKEEEDDDDEEKEEDTIAANAPIIWENSAEIHRRRHGNGSLGRQYRYLHV
jgi:hypothetical protein